MTCVVDHEWCRSIYFKDPNGLQLEYCATVREVTAEDKEMKHHDQPGPMVKDPKDARKLFEMLMSRNPPKTSVGSPV